MLKVKIEALQNPFEKLVNYMDLCECCMYGFPNDLWDNKQAAQLRESYKKSAFGAMDFILKCYPELKDNDAVVGYLEERMFEMERVVDSYFVSEDKRNIKSRSYEEISRILINNVCK